MDNVYIIEKKVKANISSLVLTVYSASLIKMAIFFASIHTRARIRAKPLIVGILIISLPYAYLNAHFVAFSEMMCIDHQLSLHQRRQRCYYIYARIRSVCVVVYIDAGYIN